MEDDEMARIKAAQYDCRYALQFADNSLNEMDYTETIHTRGDEYGVDGSGGDSNGGSGRNPNNNDLSEHPLVFNNPLPRQQPRRRRQRRFRQQNNNNNNNENENGNGNNTASRDRIYSDNNNGHAIDTLASPHNLLTATTTTTPPGIAHVNHHDIDSEETTMRDRVIQRFFKSDDDDDDYADYIPNTTTQPGVVHVNHHAVDSEETTMRDRVIQRFFKSDDDEYPPSHAAAAEQRQRTISNITRRPSEDEGLSPIDAHASFRRSQSIDDGNTSGNSDATRRRNPPQARRQSLPGAFYSGSTSGDDESDFEQLLADGSRNRGGPLPDGRQRKGVLTLLDENQRVPTYANSYPHALTTASSTASAYSYDTRGRLSSIEHSNSSRTGLGRLSRDSSRLDIDENSDLILDTDCIVASFSDNDNAIGDVENQSFASCSTRASPRKFLFFIDDTRILPCIRWITYAALALMILGSILSTVLILWGDKPSNSSMQSSSSDDNDGIDPIKQGEILFDEILNRCDELSNVDAALVEEDDENGKTSWLFGSTVVIPNHIINVTLDIHNALYPSSHTNISSCSPQTLATFQLAITTATNSSTTKPLRELFRSVEFATRYALTVFYFSTNGLQWRNRAGWLTDNQYCKWLGVSCSDIGIITGDGEITREVTGLELRQNSLVGALPPDLFNTLTSLQVFDLSGNQCTGIIPTETGSLKNLSRLILVSNQLTGSIPIELTKSDSLEVLILGSNALKGSIPSELGFLSLLEHLNLGDNIFDSGTLPSEIFGLTKLTHLSVSSLSMTGTLPTEVGKLSKLTEMKFSRNVFTSSLPIEIGALVSLHSWDMSDNQFSGSIPSEIGYLTKLRQMNFEQNNLDGIVPTELASLTSIEKINLSANNLIGSLDGLCKVLVKTTRTQLLVDEEQGSGYGVECSCCDDPF